MDSTLEFSSATTITLFSLTLLILYFFRPSKGSQYREAPIALGAWPILGHIPLLNNSHKPHVTLGEMADTYGPIFTIKLGNKKSLVINNWEMAKECFTTNDIAVSSRPQLVAIDHLTYNQALLGFAPYGPYWREMRKFITSAFLSNHRIDLLSHVLVSIIHDSTKELFNVWSNRKKEHRNGFALVELKQWLRELTFNIVRRCCIGKGRFGVTNNNSDARRIVKALRDLMHHFGVFTVSDVVPLLRRFDLGGHERAMKETAKEWDNILSEWLEEHRREWTSGEDVESEQDFMDVMHSRIDGRMMIQGHDADSIIKATTLALIAGAIDPTTVTITWAMCLLLNNPDTLEKVKEELRVQIGEERLVTDSDLSNLIYLQAVVKETLRLYPANPLSSPRTFAEDCTIGGYHVKKGTRLITNLWKIHTDPNIWQDPFEFKPERFLTTHKNVDVKGHHFALLPFGSGRRVCPGISFGLRIVHLTLANFLHSFGILVPSSGVIDMSESFGLTNVKTTPLEVLIKPRLSPKLYETK